MPVNLPRIVEEFTGLTDNCASLDELAVLLEDAARDAGFDFYALTFCDNLHQTAPRFGHLDNYPAAYAEVFVAQRLYRVDPILHAAQRSVGGFAWESVGRFIPLATGQAELLARAAREGLRDGYTVPANVPGEPCGAISFAARRPRALTPARRSYADGIGRIAFETSRRLRGLSFAESPVPHLNGREVQCLRLLREGESDKAIARALGISPETVSQYIKMARASYGARTRTELVAKALRDGQIAFDCESDRAMTASAKS